MITSVSFFYTDVITVKYKDDGYLVFLWGKKIKMGLMQSHDCLICFRYYAQNSTGSCERCHKGCKECMGPNPTDCLFCDAYFYLLRSKNKCVSSCPEYFYEDKENNVCERCHPSCQTCEGKKHVLCFD